MKINSTFVLSNLVVVPIVFSIITCLFYRGNTDAYDYVDTYLKQSKVIKVTIPKQYDEKWEYYTFRAGKKGSRDYDQIIFYSSKYRKYLALVSFSDLDMWGSYDIEMERRMSIYAYQGTIFAYANTIQWSDAKYGTKELPMPIFFIKATHRWNNRVKIDRGEKPPYADIIDYNSTRKFVEQYLVHFLPEDEFDRLFKGKEE